MPVALFRVNRDSGVDSLVMSRVACISAFNDVRELFTEIQERPCKW